MTRTLAFALVGLVTGCTVGPDYVAPVVETPLNWRFEAGEAAELANVEWWRQFDDPVLDELIQEALEQNYDVRIAAARVEEFAARIGLTESEGLPQIGYGGDAGVDQLSRETPTGVPPGVDRTNEFYSATLNFGWELDIWGRIRRASEAARAELLTADEGRRTVILSLVSAVATSYIELLSLDKQLEIAERTLQTRYESLRLFEVQRDGGVVSDLEVAQIRSEYEQAAVQVPRFEEQIALQENLISVLLGRHPGAITRGRTFVDLPKPPIPGGLPSDLLTRRPDIRAAEQVLVAANARVGVAEAEFFPRIALTGFLGFASDDLGNLAQSTANIWSIGGQLAGPIFTGGALESQLEATEAVRRQALIGYIQTIQISLREVEDALVSSRKTREQLEALGRQVASLEEYARLARERYDNGYVSFIEVLDAERRLFDAELIEVGTENAVYAALVDVYKSMGGGWVLRAETVADAADESIYHEDPSDAPIEGPGEMAPTPGVMRR
ncbi:MAG: efflux transporter outer membrane subunit [Planctomycetes bacterium]|nr:efflux transporter outer membrane subunit [Planctomycetota bacterium]